MAVLVALNETLNRQALFDSRRGEMVGLTALSSDSQASQKGCYEGSDLGFGVLGFSGFLMLADMRHDPLVGACSVQDSELQAFLTW